MCHEDDGCRGARAARLDRVRRGGDGTVLFVGAGTCGRANGALRVIERMRASFLARPEHAIVEVGCVGYCQREVFVDLQRPTAPASPTATSAPRTVDEFLETVFSKGELATASCSVATTIRDGRYRGRARRRRHAVLRPADQGRAGQLRPDRPRLPRRGPGRRRLPRRARALTTMTPGEVCDKVLASGLRGRGGAGFPTGQKWKVALDSRAPRSTSSATPTRATPGPSWTAPCSRATPSGWSRACSSPPTRSAPARATSTVAPSTRWPSNASATPSASAARPACWADNILGSLFDFDITIKQGAGAFVAAKRRRSWRASRAAGACPGPGRPSRRSPACTASHRPQQRRDAGQRAGILARGAEWFRDLGIRRSGRHQGLRPQRPVQQHRPGGGAGRHPAARGGLRHRRRRPGGPPDQGRADRRPQRRLYPRRPSGRARPTTAPCRSWAR